MVDLNVGYKNVNMEDEVEVVVDIPQSKMNDEMYIEDEAINRAEQLLKQKKIGPRNVSRLDPMSTEMLDFNRTSKPLNHYSATRVMGEGLQEATKNTDFKVKMKTPSGMKMVRVTVPIKDFVVDMAKIEDAARRKVKGDMVNFDFVGDIKMEADLTKSQIKKVHDKADELPKDSFRDRYGKKQGDAVRYATATKMVKKKLGIKEDRRLYVETIAGLKKKAEKSGMPYSILKKVYDRGMAAWKGGHRPGATQQQWAFARVNSFVTKSSGTWGGADKDLAAKVRGSK